MKVNEKFKGMSIKDYLKKTDFIPKLYAAVENIEHAGSMSVFDGLQNTGQCTVNIIFDGADQLNIVPASLKKAEPRPEVKAKEQTNPKPAAAQQPQKGAKHDK
jgi:hypothetical protein